MSWTLFSPQGAAGAENAASQQTYLPYRPSHLASSHYSKPTIFLYVRERPATQPSSSKLQLQGMGSTQSGGLSENPLNWPCIAEAFRTAPSATPHRLSLSLSLSFSLSVSHHPLVPSRLSSPARLSPAKVSSLPTAEALGPSPGAAPVP